MEVVILLIYILAYSRTGALTILDSSISEITKLYDWFRYFIFPVVEWDTTSNALWTQRSSLTNHHLSSLFEFMSPQYDQWPMTQPARPTRVMAVRQSFWSSNMSGSCPTSSSVSFVTTLVSHGRYQCFKNLYRACIHTSSHMCLW